MQKHLEITIEAPTLYEEYVSEFMQNRYNCSGIVLSEIDVKDDKITRKTNGVKAYLWIDENNPIDIEEIQKSLHEEREAIIQDGNFDIIGTWNVSATEIKEEDWAHNWKKFWHPLKIGEKIIICPSWETVDADNGEIVVSLDPGSAFGTGTHPTTRLCVEAIEKYVSKGDTVADIGMGSGILAIAALKLGAKSAVGVDNDPSVIEVAKENAEMNNCLSLCDFYCGTADDVKGQYDIVVANILANIIIEILPDLKKLMKQDAKLILSGINVEKTNDVLAAVEKNNLTHLETITSDGWVAIVVK